MYLPDINVWLALVFEVHAHHIIAQSWFDKIGDNSCAICRMTQQGLLRLSTNPTLFGDKCLTMAKTWEVYDRLINDPRIYFIKEPEGLDSFWRIYTFHINYSPKIWNDAYLAAFAKCMDIFLITFDKGFKRYEGLEYILLRE